jgi:hypothetical protein
MSTWSAHMREIIRTSDAPSSPMFSQAIKVGSAVLA